MAEEYDIYFPTKITPDEYKKFHVWQFLYDESLESNIYEFDAYPGYYCVLLWGAEGGGPKGEMWGGGGAMTYTRINVLDHCKLYIYLGEYSDRPNSTTFNGSLYPSTNGCYPGGGATDIRMVHDPRWWKEDTLTSRIIVAGAGGGAPAEYPDESLWRIYYLERTRTENYSSYTPDSNQLTAQFYSFGLNNSSPSGPFWLGDRSCAGIKEAGQNKNPGRYANEVNGSFGISSRINGTGGGGFFTGASSLIGYPGTGGSSKGSSTSGMSFVVKQLGNIREVGDVSYTYPFNNREKFPVQLDSSSINFCNDRYPYTQGINQESFNQNLYGGNKYGNGNCKVHFPRIIGYPNPDKLSWQNFPDSIVTPSEKALDTFPVQPYGNRGHGAAVIMMYADAPPFQYQWDALPMMQA